ncbi:MAG: putative Ig domain-containing protein [Candidatus Omnitrophica bacterium]|nr:putative Ig domain-containing protein [Candidatus Omnitrophota bacterium]
MRLKKLVGLILGVLIATSFATGATAQGIAYGTLNNFDTVNDTGVPCHGFEIEIEDIHSKDITYTYDWNHYGVPNITEDNSDPLHSRVFVRYESKKNPDGSWASFTAVPSGPISPTNGHQFTNPSVNFGGEHFGVGFYGTPTAVRYFWLIDDGSGNLIRGAPLNIATPAFTYFPPVNLAPAQVQAVIEPPPPPEIPVIEFGEAMWVKETRTQTHNNNKVELRDLVSDDPDDPNDRNWKNGEPDEVEVEWQLMQTEFNAADGGGNGELAGAPEDLPDGDEIITRRYDFFKYIGPLDGETGEALADKVGPDDVHGVGSRIINDVTVDLSTVEVVGEYIGAQMAGFDPAGQIGLIDHLQDGEIDVPYVERTIVVGGTPPIITTRDGALPDGMTFDEVTGVLSGTPIVSGTFTFTVHSADANLGDVSNTYHLAILDGIIVEPLHIMVTTMASPPGGGSTIGDGEYVVGATVTVVANANLGYEFVNWTDGGTIVSTSSTYEFVADVNRELVANFLAPTPTPTDTPIPTATNTDTPIPVPTDTDTPIPTATDTDTPIPTATDTDTPVPTPTETETPIPTATPTDTTGGCGLAGDLDGNGEVGLGDLLMVANSFGSSIGDSNYNPAADVDGDGDVDIFDLVRVAVHYRETCVTKTTSDTPSPGLKQSAPSFPMIEIIPSESTPTVGSVIEVTVQIANAEDIVGIEYNVHYNSSALQFLGLAGASEFLSVGDGGQVGTFTLPPSVETEDTVQLAIARLSKQGASGSGVLQRLRFGVVGSGPCGIGVGEIQLSTSLFEGVAAEGGNEAILTATLDIAKNNRVDAADLARALEDAGKERSLDRTRILFEFARYWMELAQ